MRYNVNRIYTIWRNLCSFWENILVFPRQFHLRIPIRTNYVKNKFTVFPENIMRELQKAFYYVLGNFDEGLFKYNDFWLKKRFFKKLLKLGDTRWRGSKKIGKTNFLTDLKPTTILSQTILKKLQTNDFPLAKLNDTFNFHYKHFWLNLLHIQVESLF